MVKEQSKRAEHYYTKSPTSKLKTYNIIYNVGSYSVRLATADGVFSKHSVDFGSDLLIKTVISEESPKSLLDIGCGYGVVGISLSIAFGCPVVMCDINERAVELAKSNAKSRDIRVVQSDGFENIDKRFEVIVTNPPIRAGKAVYYKWFTDSTNYMGEGGRLYCVIQKKQGAPSAINHLKSIYGNCEVIAKDKGYYIIKCKK